MKTRPSLQDALAQEFRSKGLEKQAILLQGPAGYAYFKTLSSDQWASVVEEVLGKNLMDLVERMGYDPSRAIDGFAQYEGYPPNKVFEPDAAERLVRAIFPETPSFSSRTVEFDPLEIRVRRGFRNEDMVEATDKYVEANKLINEVRAIISSELDRQSRGDNDLLYNVFADHIAEGNRRITNPERHRERVSNLVERLKSYEKFFPHDPHQYVSSVVIPGNFGLLCELVPSHDLHDESGEKVKGSLYEYSHERLGGADYYDESHARYVKSEVDRLVLHAEKALGDEAMFSRELKGFAENLRKSLRQRAIEEGKTRINQSHEDPYENGQNYIEFFIDWYNIDFEGIKYDWKGNATDALISGPVDARKNFLENFEFDLDKLKRTLVGIQQILEGGKVTNESAHPYSIMQNHGYLPNIKLPESAMKRLGEISEKVNELIDGIPDISDILADRKERGRKSITYTIEELPKNPLDVDFGRDSGCCLLVTDNPEIYTACHSIPYFLMMDSVRLFGIYNQKAKSRNRMGLVVAFDTTPFSSADITDSVLRLNYVLSANSLELSRRGLIGGRNTIQELSHYSEEWLVRYAQEAGYSGATMGASHHNTSVNYSLMKGALNESYMEFTGPDYPIHSDIFSRWREGGWYLPPGRSYWLWKKEGVPV